jgi:hypothetical protein
MALGDWLLVQMQRQAHESVKMRVQQEVERRIEFLTSLLATSPVPGNALRAIADLDAPRTQPILKSVFQRKASGLTSTALEIVQSRSNEDWTEDVYQLLARTNPNGPIPEPHTVVACAEYLLSNHYRVPQVRDKLNEMTTRELGDAAIVALEYLPDLSRELFRRALRSSVPLDRTAAAAALAILDQPWSREELQNVLRESTDQQATAECRAALRALPHADLWQCVQDWEIRNPHEPETGRFITIEESLLQSRDAFLQQKMEDLHERVLPLRTRAV